MAKLLAIWACLTVNYLKISHATFNAVVPVKDPGADVDHGQDDDGHNYHPGPWDGAEVPGGGRLANVDVPLYSQNQGQPDGGIVEELGRSLHKQLESKTECFCPLHVHMSTK